MNQQLKNQAIAIGILFVLVVVAPIAFAIASRNFQPLVLTVLCGPSMGVCAQEYFKVYKQARRFI